MKFPQNLNCVNFSVSQNNKKKQILIAIVNSISFHICLASENFVYFLIISSLFPPDDVLSKITDLSHLKKNWEKAEIESNF